jgi:hypothetical protein
LVFSAPILKKKNDSHFYESDCRSSHIFSIHPPVAFPCLGAPRGEIRIDP